MYENGIDVLYRLRDDRTGEFGDFRKVHLPGWCAGDPQMAVALHFFGHRSHTPFVSVEDWQPA